VDEKGRYIVDEKGRKKENKDKKKAILAVVEPRLYLKKEGLEREAKRREAKRKGVSELYIDEDIENLLDNLYNYNDNYYKDFLYSLDEKKLRKIDNEVRYGIGGNQSTPKKTLVRGIIAEQKYLAVHGDIYEIYEIIFKVTSVKDYISFLQTLSTRELCILLFD
jgi:hypothetical protein